MTRTGLHDHSGRRHRFGAVFVGRGSRSAFLGAPREALLFRDVYDADTGVPVSDHECGLLPETGPPGCRAACSF
jgi:hypothetical protein